MLPFPDKPPSWTTEELFWIPAVPLEWSVRDDAVSYRTENISLAPRQTFKEARLRRGFFEALMGFPL